MFGKNKDNDEVTEIQDEEFEFYDMADFEKRVFKKLNIIEMKLDGLSGETNENQERLKNIQFQFTKATLWRIAKWSVILIGIYYIYTAYFAPFILSVQSKYYQTDSPLELLAEQNGGGWWSTATGFFSRAKNAIDTVRPNDTATTTATSSTP